MRWLHGLRMVAAGACVAAVAGGAGVARSADAPAPARTAPVALLDGTSGPHILPGIHGVTNTVTTSDASEQLSTYGRPVRVGSSTYWLGIDVFNEGPGSWPDLGVYLLREAAPGHWQIHEYSWLAFRPPTFAVNPKAMTATLATGRAEAPSSIHVSFTPRRVYSHSCALVGGGTGVYRKATGTISVSAFKVVTNTSPVFGTITVRPRQAILSVDPGCRSSTVSVNEQPCPRPEVLDAPGPAPSEWGAFTNAAGTRVEIDAISASMTPTREQHSHMLEETLPIADLPRPAATATGATAVLLTRGSVFAAGEGVFTSNQAPRVITGSCTLDGVAHTYSTSEYRGVLSPGAARLIALWDTGHIPLVPDTPAFLLLSRLTS